MAGYVRQSAAQIITGNVVMASDLNAEFNALASAFNAASGHAHDGSAGNGPKISLTTSVAGILPVANGGTGASTPEEARNNLGVQTQSQLDSRYVLKSGDTMTGSLHIRTDQSRVLWFRDPDNNETGYVAQIPSAGNQIIIRVREEADATARDFRFRPDGRLSIPSDPTQSTDVTTKGYVDNQVATRLPLTGGTLTGSLTATTLISTGQIQIPEAMRVLRDGNTVYIQTGDGTSGSFKPLSFTKWLQGTPIFRINENNVTFSVPAIGVTPTSSTHLTTKGYVDTQVNTRVSKSGDTMTGALTVPGLTSTSSVDLNGGASIRFNTTSGNSVIFFRNGSNVEQGYIGYFPADGSIRMRVGSAGTPRTAIFNTAGNLSLPSLTATGRVEGSLTHRNHGGYVEIGSYGSSYGTGYGRMWWDANNRIMSFQSSTSGDTTVNSNLFRMTSAPTENFHVVRKMDLDSGLAGKANTSHTHTISQVSGLQSALDARVSNVRRVGPVSSGSLTHGESWDATAGYYVTGLSYSLGGAAIGLRAYQPQVYINGAWRALT